MIKQLLLVVLIFFSTVLAAHAALYEVKPNTPMDTIGEVPWATLLPGDVVRIHWRPQPYAEKWVIGRSGSLGMPITVQGVPGPNGELPVIDGRNAVTAPGLNFWSENRGVIKIGGANVPSSVGAEYIVIENLEIRSGHPSYTFTDDSGAQQTYSTSASSIFVELGGDIIIRNCRIHDSANGFFVASSDDGVSYNITVEGNYIFGNGVSGSIFQHNSYTAAYRITFQYNRFGPPRAGAPGVNLKDRSAGLVVRYNWIEGGNRNLDLVDGEDSSIIRNAPEYRKTFVYGNILIKQDGGNNQAVHYGGDSGTTANYRKGKLYFYNNTLYSIRAGTTVAMRLSTNDEHADARNNIFFNTAVATNMAMLAEAGTLTLANNWAKTGWRNSHEGGGFTGSVTGGATMITGAAPGFVDAANQDFKLQEGSQAINAGTALHPDVAAAGLSVFRQYLRHQSSEIRPSDGVLDLGTYERATAAPMQIVTMVLDDALRARHYSETLLALGGSGSYVWSIAAGSLPPGLYLDPQTGMIRGRSRRTGTYTFIVEVADPQGLVPNVTKQFTVNSRLHF
jgi:hypothetical protein